MPETKMSQMTLREYAELQVMQALIIADKYYRVTEGYEHLIVKSSVITNEWMKARTK